MNAGVYADKLSSSISDVSGDNTGDLAAAIATLPGVSLVASGFSVLGLDPAQNLTTLGGMLFTGPALPRDASAEIGVGSIATDAARGGFSGARVDVSLFSIAGPTRSIRFSVDHPGLQWQPGRGVGADNQYSNIQASGFVSDRIAGGRGSASFSWQLGRRAIDLLTLTSLSASSLLASRISGDSIRELLKTAEQEQLLLPTVPPRRETRNAAFATTWSVTLSENVGVGFTAVGGVTRSEREGVSATTHPSFGRGAHTSNVFMLGRLSQYIGPVLHEFKLAGNIDQNRSTPLFDAPTAQVAVASLTAGADPVFTTLMLGGNPSVDRRKSWNLELNDRVSWMSMSGRHRFDITASGRIDGYAVSGTNNANGTFVFASLADFRTGTPALFTRTREQRERSGRDVVAFAALTDLWRPSDRLRLVSGIRVDVNGLLDPPRYIGVVDTLLGARTDEAPFAAYFGPSAGLTWSYGSLPERLKTQSLPQPRATIGAGISTLTGTFPRMLLDRGRAQNGPSDVVANLVCVGPAAPRPEWGLYAKDHTTIPSDCLAGQGQFFDDRAPSIYAYEPSLSPNRSLRGNAWWSGLVSASLRARFEVVQSADWNRMAPVDLNLATDRGFTLGDEGHRPVFVRPQDIDQRTGVVSLPVSRKVSQLGRVYENRSDLHAHRTQLSAQFTRTSSNLNRFVMLGYTFLRVREQSRGLSGTTASNPLQTEWIPGSNDQTHQLTLVGSLAHRGVTLSVMSRIQSGYLFTPLIGADVNGDGLVNDRAFVFDPRRGGDSALGRSMRDLLDAAPGRLRKCLETQSSQAASANSCAGPWGATTNIALGVRGDRIRLPRRTQASVVVYNAVAAIDRALHGQARMHGWGQFSAGDPVLLEVRGFDPRAHRFAYQVNPFFGQRSVIAQFAMPMRVSVEFRVDLGPDRERELVEILLHGGLGRINQPHRDSAAILNDLVGRGPTGITTILARNSGVVLTDAQRRDLVSLRDSLINRDRGLFAPVAGYLASLREDFDVREVRRHLDPAFAASADGFEAAMRKAISFIPNEQLRETPPYLRRALDPERAGADRRRGIWPSF